MTLKSISDELLVIVRGTLKRRRKIFKDTFELALDDSTSSNLFRRDSLGVSNILS
jgi:purine-nucleoside phosphorylase